MTKRTRRQQAPVVRALPAPDLSRPGGTSMSPGVAPPPAAGMVAPGNAPRQFSFPVGYNIGTRPRASEATAFETLREFAALYSGIQLCERVYLDIIGRLAPQIVTRDGAAATGDAADAARDFVAAPDGERDLRAWLSAATRDLLEIDAVAIYRRRRRNGRLFGLDLVDGACYAGDMEVLTKAGWKRFEDVDLETDLFATRNPTTKAFEWQKATYFHEADWDSTTQGDLYHFTSRTLDLRVSPNHRMLVSSLPRSLGGSWHREAGEVIITAEQLAKAVEDRRDSGHTMIPATSAWEVPDVPEIHIPATTPRSSAMMFSGDDFAAFLGMWLAEGTASNGDQIYITQQPDSQGFAAFKELLERIWGRSVCHTGRNFVIGHKALHDYLRQFGQAHEKFVPEAIREMSRRQLAIFWHYYVLGDGSYDQSKSGTVRERVKTVSKELADDLQEILQKMGYSSSIQVSYPTSDKTLSDGRIIKIENQRVAYTVTKRTSTHHVFRVKRLPYKGKIYCVSVPNEILYVRHNGKPAWCGNTIKPLLDITGRRPAPPAPAYQQFVWGVPAGRYSTRELDYLCESPRVDSPYGFSRVERILFCVNHALRKQHYDLARFTDGVVPSGLLVPPPALEWTAEQISEYEQSFNTYLAGNDQLRARVKVVPPGFGFTATHPEAPSTDFDRWLLNITAACFGLTMAELGMTEQVNKSSGDTQENVVYRRAVRPLADFFARYLSRIVAEEFDPALVLTWQPIDEPEDFTAKAQALATLVQSQVITPARAAALLGLAPEG